VTLLPEFQPRPIQAVDEQRQSGEESAVPSTPVPSTFNPPLEWLASLSEEEFRRTFRRSPIQRARYRGMLRNAAVAMGNSRLEKFRPLLEKLAEHPDAMVQEHARWALEQLEENVSQPQNAGAPASGLD
jgi:epoxyqueuosine reductase QueG